jgi:hypothetical protein
VPIRADRGQPELAPRTAKHGLFLLHWSELSQAPRIHRPHKGSSGQLERPTPGPCGHFAASPTVAADAPWSLDISAVSGVNLDIDGLNAGTPLGTCRLPRREYRCWGLSPDISHCRKPNITTVYPEQWLKPQSALPGQPPRAPRQRAMTRRTSSRAPYRNGEVRPPLP